MHFSTSYLKSCLNATKSYLTLLDFVHNNKMMQMLKVPNSFGLQLSGNCRGDCMRCTRTVYDRIVRDWKFTLSFSKIVHYTNDFVENRVHAFNKTDRPVGNIIGSDVDVDCSDKYLRTLGGQLLFCSRTFACCCPPNLTYNITVTPTYQHTLS